MWAEGMLSLEGTNGLSPGEIRGRVGWRSKTTSKLELSVNVV